MQNFDIHTHFNTLGLLDISDNYSLKEKSKFFSIGIHPKKLNSTNELNKVLYEISDFVSDNKCAAIGECGLDKFSDLPLNIQEKIFIPQIEIAQKNHKPLIIHCVRLYNEVVRIIKQQKFNLPVVFHGFNANSDTLKQLLKFDNFYFSVSEKILNGKNNIYKALEFLPLEKLLIESDTDKNTDFQRLLTNISMLKHEETNVVKKYIQNNFKKLLSL